MVATPVPPQINYWMRYVILFHQNNPGKEDHHDILLEVFEGDDPEQLALDKLETSQLCLGRESFSIDPQDLIRRRYLTYEGSMTGNRGFVKELMKVNIVYYLMVL